MIILKSSNQKKEKFKFISCHNWIQHTPNPSKTLFNITQNLEKGGKIYISCFYFKTRINTQKLKNFRLISF